MTRSDYLTELIAQAREDDDCDGDVIDEDDPELRAEIDAERARIEAELQADWDATRANDCAAARFSSAP